MEKFIHDEYTLTAMKLVREGKSFFITGKAGTGKTRLLGEIVRESCARGKNIVVAAPTGVAAKNAGATIETDEERTYFLIDIPCHPYFAKKEIEIDTNGVKGGVKGGVKELSDIQEVIVKEMLFDPSVTTSEMASELHTLSSVTR